MAYFPKQGSLTYKDSPLTLPSPLTGERVQTLFLVMADKKNEPSMNHEGSLFM